MQTSLDMVMTALPAAISRKAPPGSLVHIVYENESGEVSSRRVRVERWVHGRNGYSYLKGYCFMRGEDRTFRADRILEWTVDEPAAPSRILAEPAPEPWKLTWPTREVLPAPTPQTFVPTPAKRAHAGGRGWLGLLAAGAAFFIIRSLAMGGSQPAPAPVPRYVPAPKPVPKAAPKPATRTEPAAARSQAFRTATGVSSDTLDAAYERADANRDGSLDWSEISTFQSWLESKYGYRSNELALRPDQFLAEGGGDCEDWALFTCGLLRYWGWDPWVGILAPSENAVGHAICLVRVPEKPSRGRWWSVEDDGTLAGHPVKAGWYVPIDYDSVGSLSNAVGDGWKLRAIWEPESIYEKRM